MTAQAPIAKLSKSEKTKALILETALSMFQKQGYEETTMRGIAIACDVSLGNAYYYFKSKEHLVLALYERTLKEQQDACAPVLSSTKSLKKRLSGVLQTQIKALTPYRSTLRSLFKFGADPASPLSPFSTESTQIRQGAQEIFRTIVTHSQEKLPNDLTDKLPYCLWLYGMGIIFFWLHDSSENLAKTTRLIDLTSDLISSFALLLSLPLLKPIRANLFKLVDEFRLDS